MGDMIAGMCGKCGAPYTTPMVWGGVTPPPMTPSCACWNTRSIGTTTTMPPWQYIVNEPRRIPDYVPDGGPLMQPRTHAQLAGAYRRRKSVDETGVDNTELPEYLR